MEKKVTGLPKNNKSIFQLAQTSGQAQSPWNLPIVLKTVRTFLSLDLVLESGHQENCYFRSFEFLKAVALSRVQWLIKDSYHHFLRAL